MNTDSKNETSGSKWSLKALKAYLYNDFLIANQTYKAEDIDTMFSKIDDIIVKTMISVEPLLHNGIDMFIPKDLQHQACFELLGFDILLDSDLKPWLLEVNLSPSMNTDSPLDTRIKSQVLVDLFNLVGVEKGE